MEKLAKLHDNEILEIAGIKISEKLLNEPISFYFNKSVNELKSIGVSEESAIKINCLKEISSRYLAEEMKKSDYLTNPTSVVSYLRMKIGSLPNESFAGIYLNTQNKILGSEILNEGTLDQVAIYPRRIVEKCLEYHASNIILAHNHPSGFCDPSSEDKSLTRAVKDACNLFSIRVLDHLVISQTGYFSFLEGGIL